MVRWGALETIWSLTFTLLGSLTELCMQGRPHLKGQRVFNAFGIPSRGSHWPLIPDVCGQSLLFISLSITLTRLVRVEWVSFSSMSWVRGGERRAGLLPGHAGVLSDFQYGAFGLLPLELLTAPNIFLAGVLTCGVWACGVLAYGCVRLGRVWGVRWFSSSLIGYSSCCLLNSQAFPGRSYNASLLPVLCVVVFPGYFLSVSSPASSHSLFTLA